MWMQKTKYHDKQQVKLTIWQVSIFFSKLLQCPQPIALLAAFGGA